MDNSKKNPKSIDERHKRRTLDFSFPHIKIVFVITATALLSLIASIALDHFDIPFWSSILANIFAGLLTGLVICLVSGTKQIAITKLEAEVGFLNTLDTKIKDFQNLYHELLTKPFQKYDDTEELFVFIYDVGAHANWVNEYILQGSFDERLALDPMKYCIQMGYDALSLAKDYEDLHNNLYCVDVDYPTKKEILAYFEVVEKTLRGLRNAVNLRQSEIEVQLERIKYSLF